MGRLHALLSRMLSPPAVLVSRLCAGTRVTVRGVVVPRDLMDSPLGGERCVYYRYSVEQWRRSQVMSVGGDGFWQSAEIDEAILEFYVDDGSGRAIVAPACARVTAERHVVPHEVSLDAQSRARELVLVPGDTVQITAEVAVVNDVFDESRDYRASPVRMMLRAPENGYVDIRVLDTARRQHTSRARW